MIAVLALPLVMLVALLSWRCASDRVESEAASLAMRAQANGAASEQFLRKTEALLSALAARPIMISAGRGGCDPVFDTFAVQNRDYANLLLVDAQGQVRCSAKPLEAGAAPRLGPMYVLEQVKTERKFVIGRPEIGFISGRWVVPVAYPLQDAAGGVAGLIGVSIDLERFRPAVVAGSEVALMIVDGDGFVIAASEGASLKVGDRYDASLINRLAARASSNWAVEDNGTMTRLHSLAPVAGTGWYALAETDYAPIRAAMLHDGLRYGVLSVGVLLISLWFAKRIKRAIVEPVGNFAEAVRAIAGGSIEKRVMPVGAAEIVALGKEFNHMLDALAEEKRHVSQSEQELRTVLSTVDAVIYALSGDGSTLLYLSPNAEKFYGQDVRRIAADPGRRHASVLREDKQQIDALMRQLAESGHAESEYRIRHSDGSLHWMREQCHLLRDGDGAPWRTTGVISDVSASRKLLDELIESEARFRSLVRLSSDWYWEQDADYRFVELSGVSTTSAASRRASFLGKCRWEEATFGLDEAGWAEHRVRLARHETFRDFEYGISLEDGSLFYMSVSGEPIFDGAGQFKGYRGVGRDITVRRRMEDALRESEARLLLVLDATSEGVWDYNLRTDDTYFSAHFAELLGYESQREAKLLFVFREALHPEDRPRVLSAQDRALREGATFDETYRLRCKDGAFRWFHGRGLSVLDGEGKPTRFIGAIADVTAQKDAEMRLRKLSAAVEQSPVSIIITDRHGVIEYVNPCFCQVTGYTLEEVRGCNPRVLKSGETPGEVYKALWETITSGQEWSGELHNRKKNGELFWEFVRIIPLISENGEVANFMAVKEDITLHKELTAREQLRQEQMLHHARLAAMGEMAAALAHELNQPLAAIANFSGVVEHQLAASHPDLMQALDVVRTINGQALRAGDIVWRIREFSRKQASRQEPTDINALLKDVVRLADIAAKSREVAYEFDLAIGLPQVTVDRVQIEQVLLNLIRNGVEAMEGEAGGKRLVLSSRLAEGATAIQLSVRDHGCGLPDRIAVDLFTPFFTTKPEGMGMGLPISRGIVEAHGGRLWAAPNDDGGTTFYLTLPLTNGDE